MIHSEALEETIKTSREEGSSIFHTVRNTSDRLISHAVAETNSEYRKVSTFLLLHSRMLDGYLDVELSNKTREKMNKVKNNTEPPNYIFDLVSDIVSNVEYVDLVDEKDTSTINNRVWLQATSQYFESVDISPDEVEMVRQIGFNELPSIIEEIDDEVYERYRSIIDEFQKLDGQGDEANLEEMVDVIEKDMMDIDSSGRYLGET